MKLDGSPIDWRLVQPGASALPSPRYGHTCVTVDSRNSWGSELVVVFGGQSGLNAMVRDQLALFNVAEEEWTIVQPRHGSPAPSPRSFHSATVEGHRVFIFGGSGPVGGAGVRGAIFNDLWCLDTSSMTWSPVQVSGPRPSPRKGASLVNIEGKRLLLFGGKTEDNSFLGDLWILVRTERGANWSLIGVQGAKVPPRALCPALMVKDKLFIYGGSNQKDSRLATFGLNDFLFLKGINGSEPASWVQVHPPAKRFGQTPARMGHAGAVLHDNRRHLLVFFGGSADTKNFFSVSAGKPSNNLLLLDLARMSWKEIRGPDEFGWPVGRLHGGLTALSDGRFVLFGGVVTRGTAPAPSTPPPASGAAAAPVPRPLNDTWLLRLEEGAEDPGTGSQSGSKKEKAEEPAVAAPASESGWGLDQLFGRASALVNLPRSGAGSSPSPVAKSGSPATRSGRSTPAPTPLHQLHQRLNLPAPATPDAQLDRSRRPVWTPQHEEQLLALGRQCAQLNRLAPAEAPQQPPAEASGGVAALTPHQAKAFGRAYLSSAHTDQLTMRLVELMLLDYQQLAQQATAVASAGASPGAEPSPSSADIDGDDGPSADSTAPSSQLEALVSDWLPRRFLRLTPCSFRVRDVAELQQEYGHLIPSAGAT